jgi:ribosomal-protein-alanine N-acetyltransferase
VLETERLILRAPIATDAEVMFAIMADPQVMRYFGSAPMASIAEAHERIAGMTSAFAEQHGIRWVITLRGSDTCVGSCGFWRLIPEHYRAEIGYELAPAYWGQGIMPEVVHAAVQFGFGRMGLHSIEAQIAPQNVGSRRVLEKVGFVQEGYLRESYYEPVDHYFSDTAIFSLLGHEYRGTGA